jgi:aminoglycoside 6-adenylyltransferase
MLNRRDETDMLNLILQIARDDERIRAVIMNGSRTSPSAKIDVFQDYDIIYLVTDVESFVAEKSWIHQFGEMLIMQIPDEMDGKWPASKDEYAYLMQFTDWNRIDLTLLHVNRLATMPRDSQSILLLDKDNLVKAFDSPSDRDYLPKPPTEKEFNDCCNEFLWVSTYVAKGIWRKELTYAKYVAEHIVKEELIKLLSWYAGLKTDYQKPIGKFGKHLEKYIEPDIWNKFIETYVDADYTNMWEALFLMCEIYNLIALRIAKHFDYKYDQDEYNNVVRYLRSVRVESNSTT